jgi:hypothetical protein
VTGATRTPFWRAFWWSFNCTLGFAAVVGVGVVTLQPLQHRHNEERRLERGIGSRLEWAVFRRLLSEDAIVKQVGGGVLGIEKVTDGVAVIVRVRDDAGAAGWPCYRVVARRAGDLPRVQVRRLRSCPVAAPLQLRDDQSAEDLASAVQSTLDQLPASFPSAAAVHTALRGALRPNLPLAVEMGPFPGAAYVAVGRQPRCVLGFARPPPEEPLDQRSIVWLAPLDQPCSPASARSLVGLY